MTTLSDRAMLVSLNISQWTAMKHDRNETSAVTARHSLTTDAARVNKRLLPNATSLQALHEQTNLIRRDFAARTLPWLMDGVQILKADAYMDFTTAMRHHQDRWQSYVDQFVADYPAHVENAKHMLGTLFNANDYPTEREVRAKFCMGLRFQPVPSIDDWRVDVGDVERERLRRELTEQIVEAEAGAMAAAWKRVHDVVAKAHERLSQPDAIFRDTLVSNAVELCALLPSLNVLDDPALERTRQELERGLCKYNVGTLRSDPAVRSEVADKMADIMKKMSGVYAPAKVAA